MPRGVRRGQADCQHPRMRQRCRVWSLATGFQPPKSIDSPSILLHLRGAGWGRAPRWVAGAECSRRRGGFQSRAVRRGGLVRPSHGLADGGSHPLAGRSTTNSDRGTLARRSCGELLRGASAPPPPLGGREQRGASPREVPEGLTPGASCGAGPTTSRRRKEHRPERPSSAKRPAWAAGPGPAGAGAARRDRSLRRRGGRAPRAAAARRAVPGRMAVGVVTSRTVAGRDHAVRKL